MSTQAASTRPMNRPMNDPQNPARCGTCRPSRCRSMHDGRRNDMQAPGTETKQAFKTTEFWIYLIAVAAVLGASQVVGQNSAWGGHLPGRQRLVPDHPADARLPR